MVTSDAYGNLATTTLGVLGIASSGDINAINAQLASRADAPQPGGRGAG